MAVLGVAFSTIEILRDDDDVAITDVLDSDSAWVTKTAFDAADPDTTAVLTITYDADGRYQIVFTPTSPTVGPPATWAYHAIYDDGATRREFSATVEVSALRSGSIVAAVTGAPYSAIEILRDDADQPIEGVLTTDPEWTIRTAFESGDPDNAATLTITEDADGRYSFVFTPDTPLTGDPLTWTYHAVYDDGTTRREFLDTVEVAAAAPDDVVQADQHVSFALDGTALPVNTRQITLIAGDDYADADGRGLHWELSDGPSLSGATATFKITDHTGETVFSTAASIATGTPQTVIVSLTSAQTDLLEAAGRKQYRYDLAAELVNGDDVTLARGIVVVLPDR